MNSGNYDLSYQGNNLTITKALLNVIADAKTKVYGDADPSLTYQVSGLKNGAEQSVEVSASQQHVLVTAKEHITLMCGGAYLTLKGGNIELGMPGNFVVKAAKHMRIASEFLASPNNALMEKSFKTSGTVLV